MQTRRQAFKNSTEQYQRILDVVTKYSVHFGEQKVSFTCKKQGQPMSDLHTPVNSSSLENIKIAYGASVARELIPFELSQGDCYKKNEKNVKNEKNGKNGNGQHGNNSDGGSSSLNMENEITRKEDEMALAAAGLNDALVFSINGLISNANFSSKRGICIIFINNRLVECVSVKRVIEAVYAEVLPRHSHPFIYLSMRMPPQHVDVNVHPVSLYSQYCFCLYFFCFYALFD